MEEKIIVMGGSFNPPTAAHLKLMQAALDGMGASIGYMAPVSHAYLKRKMIKSGSGNLCLPDEMRVKMLQEMCMEDERIAIYTGDLDEDLSVTYDTLSRVQNLHPDAKIYFLAGADKFEIIESFCQKTDFLERFGIVIFSRAGENPKSEIEKSTILMPHKDAIVMLNQPDGIENISSTAIRDHLFDIDLVSDMLHPAVFGMLKELKKEDYPEEITGFTDEYEFMDPMYLYEIMYEGLKYPCAEAAFLASKLENNSDRKRFTEYPSEKLKQKGSLVTPYKGWESKKIEIMEDIQRIKFSVGSKLADMLIATGDKKLIFGNKKKDGFWGVNTFSWRGENNLGKILMKIRSELKGE